MYMYVCVYIYICTYTYTCTYICMHLGVREDLSVDKKVLIFPQNSSHCEPDPKESC